MSIQDQRRQSLRDELFETRGMGYYSFLLPSYKQRYTCTSTQGRLTREKPLQSVERWLKSPTEVLRKLCIKNKRMFV
jgi:hypothetical protein